MNTKPAVLGLLNKHQYVVRANISTIKDIICTVQYPERIVSTVCKATTTCYKLQYPNTMACRTHNCDVTLGNTYWFPIHLMRPYIHFDIMCSCMISNYNTEFIVTHINNKRVDYATFFNALQSGIPMLDTLQRETQILPLFSQQIQNGLPPLDVSMGYSEDLVGDYNFLKNMFVREV